MLDKGEIAPNSQWSAGDDREPDQSLHLTAVVDIDGLNDGQVHLPARQFRMG